MHAIRQEPLPLSQDMTSKFCPKVGIYFAHYECYGHTSIVTAIGEVYKKRFPSGNLFFIQAGLDQPKAKIDRLGKVFTLPNAFVSRRNFRELNQGVSSEVSKRSAIFTEILKRENPNLLITEFFPLGWEECRHELIPSLVRCASQDTALWAISGHPLVAGSNFEWREKILKLYQKIIILCPVLEKKFFAEFHVRKNERQMLMNTAI